MARQINDDGLKLIESFEGLFLTAYHGAADRPGLLSLGYGHTDAAGPPTVTAGMTITKEQADAILCTDLSKVEADVESLVKVPLNDNQFAALVSFAFNCGSTALKNSSLLRKLNAGDYDSVPESLMAWVNANGKRVQGLVRRRVAEGELWSRDSMPSSNTVEVDSPVDAEDIQKALNAAGYGPLTVDGKLGPKSLAAIMEAIKKGAA